MVNREIEAKLKLSAVDRTGKAFKSISHRLNDVNKRAAVFNRTGEQNRKTFAAVGRAAAVATTAVATAGAAAAKKFAGDERTLTRIGITAGKTREEMANIRDTLFEMSKDTGLQFDDAIRGLATMTSSSLEFSDAIKLLPSVMATAQAAGADVEDIASSADALFVSMGVNSKNMQLAFDTMVSAGKLGKFELKDMAQHLPSLTAGYKTLGNEGVDGLRELVAYLQVVRNHTGTAGEAATAFGDVINKLESQTVTNNFKRFGIDLRAALSDARKEGNDVLETFIALSNEAVKGDLSKLPQLFTDKQMLTGMRALLSSPEAINKMSESLKNVNGSTLKDLGRVLSDNQAKIDAMSNSWDRMVSSFGSVVAPAASTALDGITDFVERDLAQMRGMEMDGLSRFEALAAQIIHGHNSEQAIKWQKMGGYNFEPFEGGEKEAGVENTVPTPSPVGGSSTLRRSGTPIPVMRGREDEFSKKLDEIASMKLPASQSEIDARAKMIEHEDVLFRQTTKDGISIAPAMSDEENRRQGSQTQFSEFDVGAAKKRADLRHFEKTDIDPIAIEKPPKEFSQSITTPIGLKSVRTGNNSPMPIKRAEDLPEVRPDGGRLKQVLDLDSDEAELVLSDLAAKAEKPMITSLDLDTSAAEAKLSQLRQKAESLQKVLNSRKSVVIRERGRSMPDT